MLARFAGPLGGALASACLICLRRDQHPARASAGPINGPRKHVAAQRKHARHDERSEKSTAAVRLAA
jgi:hypothetical protein